MTRQRGKRGAGTVVPRAGKFRPRWRLKGKTFYGPAYALEDEARDVLSDVASWRRREGLSLDAALARLTPDTSTPTGAVRTFAKLLDLYLEDCDRKCDLRVSTREGNRVRARILRRAPWAGSLIDDIHRRDVRAWVTERRAQGVSGGTVVNDLTLASSVFNWADLEELIDPDTVNPFPRSRPKRFSRKERWAIEPDGLQALSDAIQSETPALWPLFLATMFSGWRGTEQCELKEAELDLNKPSMTVYGADEKMRHEKVAILGEPLVSILLAERQTRPRLPSALVFTDGNGRRWTSETRVAGLRKALVKVPLNVIPAKMRIETRTHLAVDWHTLRHSVRTLLGALGHRDVAVGDLLGQKDPATLRRYDHSLNAEAQAIAADITGFLSGREDGKQPGNMG